MNIPQASRTATDGQHGKQHEKSVHDIRLDFSRQFSKLVFSWPTNFSFSKIAACAAAGTCQ